MRSKTTLSYTKSRTDSDWRWLPAGTPSKTYGVKIQIPKGVWNTLAIDFNGDVLKVVLNGAVIFDVVDATFSEPGKVGLWTKADSVTYFDDFRIERKPETRPR